MARTNSKLWEARPLGRMVKWKSRGQVMKHDWKIYDPRNITNPDNLEKKVDRVQAKAALEHGELRLLLQPCTLEDIGALFLSNLLARFPADYLFVDLWAHDAEVLNLFGAVEVFNDHIGLVPYSNEAIADLSSGYRSIWDQWFELLIGCFSIEHYDQVVELAKQDKIFVQEASTPVPQLVDFAVILSLDFNTIIVVCKVEGLFDSMIEFVASYSETTA